MRSIYFIVLLIISGFGFISCEEVIVLNLNDTEPRIIIEAVLDVGNQSCRVDITQSSDFYDANAPTRLSGATITLSDDLGNLYPIEEAEPGIYIGENISASIGQTFTIIITDSLENNYTASALTPAPATLTGADIFDFGAQGGPGPGGNNPQSSFGVFPKWEDPAGVENFYRIRAYQNDTLLANSYTLVDDEGQDGQEMFRPIQFAFEEQDTVRIQLLSINEEMLDYFYQISDIAQSGLNSSVPYNPTGNFDNGALGYFGIVQISEQTIIVE